jgi:hypothetical protein
MSSGGGKFSEQHEGFEGNPRIDGHQLLKIQKQLPKFMNS